MGVKVEAGETGQATTRNCFLEGAGIFSSFFKNSPKGQSKSELSQQELQEYNEIVRARRGHPELIPSMFLWKDFGEGCNCINLRYSECVRYLLFRYACLPGIYGESSCLVLMAQVCGPQREPMIHTPWVKYRSMSTHPAHPTSRPQPLFKYLNISRVVFPAWKYAERCFICCRCPSFVCRP